MRLQMRIYAMVCYTRPTNAVLVSCGHGGVCYKCAAIHVKKRQECMECRAAVEGIAYIQKETGLQGVFRSNQFIKIIKTEAPAPEPAPGTVVAAPSVPVGGQA